MQLPGKREKKYKMQEKYDQQYSIQSFTISLNVPGFSYSEVGLPFRSVVTTENKMSRMTERKHQAPGVICISHSLLGAIK